MRSAWKYLFGVTLLEIVSLTHTGCNTSGCTENRSAIPLADFYSSQDGYQITLDSLQISGIGAPGDSILMTAGTRANQVYLPMRAMQKTTSWCLAYKWEHLDNPALNDTLTFHYEAQPWFASDECGAMYYYHIHKVEHTTHLMDSVAITDSLVTNATVPTIRLYFKTGDTTEE